MTELCKIMNHYGSDKGSGWHNYTTTYHDLFKKKREEELNVFELGIGDAVFVQYSQHDAKSGASIRGWRDYFPNANVYGGDIDKTVLFEDDRIKTFYCDQLDSAVIKEMWENPELKDKKFDIIIDDGLHEFDANINFFRNSFHKLKDDGIFIIEDLHQITLPRFKEALPELKLEFPHLDFSILEILNPQNYSDNNIVVIQRKNLVNHIDIVPSEANIKLRLAAEESLKKLMHASGKAGVNVNPESFVLEHKKKVVDCFTFYNELDVLELRLTELYDVVDYFILVEADHTHKGDSKSLIFEENKERFSKWSDKIINISVSFPSHLDVWGREKYQRNAFMPVLYSLGLKNEDIVLITDADEIPDPERITYIKNTQKIEGIFKLEMDMYFACLSNKQVNVKWYHPKLMNWGTLKNSTPDECRLNFNCQWWEKGGWHLTYFGDPSKISNKLQNFAHQEYNSERFTNEEHILNSVKEGKDLFGETRIYEKINPSKNQYLPKNWKILEKFEDLYSSYGNTESIKSQDKKNLVLGTAIDFGIEDIKKFVKSFRRFNKVDDLYLVLQYGISKELKDFLDLYDVNILYNESMKFTGIHINNSRFIKYLDFVTENSDKYNHILLSDTRDVIFQKNIFDKLPAEDFIYFAEEDETECIKDNVFNSYPVTVAFGEKMLEFLGPKKILCAGTTIGSLSNITVYLREMVSNLYNIHSINHTTLKQSVDQAIHNFLYYEKESIFKNPLVKQSGDLMATVGITSSRSPEKITVAMGEALDFLNDRKSSLSISVNGKIPSVIHQFDRSISMTEFYNKIYE